VKSMFTTIASIDRERAESGQFFREFLRVPAMSAGLYVLSAGSIDPQIPHHQDELYYVLRGCGRFRAGGEDTEIAPGSVLFVAAEVEHKFYDITEELAVLVFFAPAES
jgi:mannose-6-phosphate isomerase-like protein (cupin superfamily)